MKRLKSGCNSESTGIFQNWIMKSSSNLNISCKDVFSLNKWNKKVGSPSSLRRKWPFISLNSSASIENLAYGEIWINQSAFSRREKLWCPDVTQILCSSLRFLRDQRSLYRGSAVLFQRFLQIYCLPYFCLLKDTYVCNYIDWMSNQDRFKTFFWGERLR